MDLRELDTRELGKHFEHLLMSKLIKLHFDIFVPLLDKGIDFIVRVGERDNGSPRYFEVQVKSVRKEGGRLTISKSTFTPHKGLFLVFFYVKDPEKEEYDTYVIPSEFVRDEFSSQTQGKRGKNGKEKREIYRLGISNTKLKEIEPYKWNDFEFIPDVWKN
jgi:hypothetical protein